MRLTITILISMFYGLFNKKANDIAFGTAIIVAAGTDGIIIASDSRYVFGKDYDNLNSYIDSCQKIYNVKGYPIAIAGRISFDGVPIWDLVKEYNSTKNKPLNFQENFKDFIEYVAKLYPLSKESTQFYTAGYVDKEPLILWRSQNEPIYSIKNFITNGNRFDSEFIKHYKKTDCKSLAKISEKVMIEYIAKYHQHISKEPVQIVKVGQNNKFSYLQNDFSKKPLGLKQKF